MLPPLPDFRYVGLGPAPNRRLRAAGLVSAGTVAVAASAVLWSQSTVAVLAALAGSALLARTLGAPIEAQSSAFCIVPWGVIIDPEFETRVLRWPAVRRVHVETRHGSDQGTPTTLFSTVLVETEREAWRGSAPGAVPLDQLVTYLGDYTEEQCKPVGLGLFVEGPQVDPMDPACESLLAAATTYVRSAEAARLLDLPSGGYRNAGAMRASSKGLEVLGDVLRGRHGAAVDARAFAALLAAELDARPLAEDLARLVQCPHPVVAAVAKAAALRLGVPQSRTGTLDEVRPFLHGEDASRLLAWSLGTG